MSNRRQYQKQMIFTPEPLVVPRKRVAAPKPYPRPACPTIPQPKPENVETLTEKLIRLGWIDASGRSLDWHYWFETPRVVYYEGPSGETITSSIRRF